MRWKMKISATLLEHRWIINIKPESKWEETILEAFDDAEIIEHRVRKEYPGAKFEELRFTLSNPKINPRMNDD